MPLPAVIRTEFHLHMIRHLRKEIRKMRMETKRRYDDIDALIDHIVRVHGKMGKCVLHGGYSRGSDLDGLMSDMIETLNLRDYGQVLHKRGLITLICYKSILESHIKMRSNKSGDFS